MQTRQTYTGPFFPAMGNHECGVSGGFSTSDNNNCGPGNQGGATPNYNAFMSQMLGPISQTNPYYSINVNATDNSWTAKFVVTAANAWDTAQQTWLTTTMAQPTTYTFVMRHEASDAHAAAPAGRRGGRRRAREYPYTLLIVGHAHTYGHYSDPERGTFGNGGAPLIEQGLRLRALQPALRRRDRGRRDRLQDGRGGQRVPLRHHARGHGSRSKRDLAHSSTILPLPRLAWPSPQPAQTRDPLRRVAPAQGQADVLAGLAPHAERRERDGELDGPLLVHVLRFVDRAVDLPRRVHPADRVGDHGLGRHLDRVLHSPARRRRGRRRPISMSSSEAYSAR